MAFLFVSLNYTNGVLKDEWQKLEKEETALIYEEIEMIHKIENIRTIPNYIEAKIFFHH